jgi:hypothetical protein
LRLASCPERDPQAQEAVAVVERGGRGGSRPPLESLQPSVRPRTHDTLDEANPRLECSPIQAPRAGRALDLAGALGLRAAETGARHRRRPEAAVGATQAAGPDLRVEEFRDTFGERWHSSKAAEPCGRSPGRPKGSRSGPAKRHPALKVSGLMKVNSNWARRSGAGHHRSSSVRSARCSRMKASIQSGRNGKESGRSLPGIRR